MAQFRRLGRVARLPARAVHDGRGVRPRGPQVLRPPLRPRPPLPRQPDRQLVPALRERDLRPRGRPPRRERRRCTRSATRSRTGTGELTIATVRPPTMLADVAVAVHPDDERYRAPVGKEAIVPVAERRVPIIADERVDPEFGTGAVKITPGPRSDGLRDRPRRTGSRSSTVIGLDGRMNEDAGEFAGLTQAGGRATAIVAMLRERDLLESAEPYRHSVGHCDRCGSRIEPLITLQWWCEMDGARGAGDRGGPRRPTSASAPSATRSVYLAGWSRIRPWCVSRQLWWGHQHSRSGTARTGT